MFRSIIPCMLLCVPSYAQPQLLRLESSDGSPFDQFGSAIDVDDQTIVVGADYADPHGAFSGTAYLFDRLSGQQLVQLVPSIGGASAVFGFSVGIHGERVVVGSRSDSAFLFERSTGNQLAVLVGSGITGGENFGEAVDVDGATVIAGAIWDNGGAASTGSAFLFDSASGAQTHKLSASDGSFGDRFGLAVAVGGTSAIVGAPYDDDGIADSGSAYLFDLTTGLQTHKLVAPIPEQFSRFGRTVAVSSTRAVVGAADDHTTSGHFGAAYLYDVATGSLIAKLLPESPGVFSEFGHSVAILDSVVAVGSHGRTDYNGYKCGAVFLFDANTGVQIGKVLPGDGAAEDFFGSSVAIQGATLVVGATGDNGNSQQSGTAYVFDVSASLGNQGYIYCSGDGSFGACPCSNDTVTGEGCLNSTHKGARLRVGGNAFVSSDTLQFVASQIPNNNPGLLLRGDNVIHTIVGDGKLCTGGAGQRSQVQLATGGTTAFTHFNGAPFAAVSNVGAETHFQFWYRDPANPCTGAGFNFSNAWTVTYLP